MKRHTDCRSAPMLAVGLLAALLVGAGATVGLGAQEINELSPGDERRAREFMADGVPEKVAELTELKLARPQEYWQLLSGALAERQGYERLGAEEPDVFRVVERERALERRSYDLARQIRGTGDAQRRAELLRELEQTVTEQFDLRERRRAEEIKRLEEELRRVREDSELRLAHRDTIVQRRVEQLTGLAEIYSW